MLFRSAAVASSDAQRSDHHPAGPGPVPVVVTDGLRITPARVGRTRWHQKTRNLLIWPILFQLPDSYNWAVPEVQSALELVLRVLTAFNEHREPEPADIEQLRKLVPDLADSPVDLLAYEAIQRTIQRTSGRP